MVFGLKINWEKLALRAINVDDKANSVFFSFNKLRNILLKKWKETGSKYTNSTMEWNTEEWNKAVKKTIDYKEEIKANQFWSISSRVSNKNREALRRAETKWKIWELNLTLKICEFLFKPQLHKQGFDHNYPQQMSTQC